MIWFTADTHLYHRNIIRYCLRPYADEIIMTEDLIRRWNSVVNPGDQVYHLGDVIFGDKNRLSQVMSRLNGEVTLIFGNHDQQIKKLNLTSLFKHCADELEVTIEDQHILMRHYPVTDWPGRAAGTWLLHGHAHGQMVNEPHELIYDVGVDVPFNNYTPISFESLRSIMMKRARWHKYRP